MTTQTPRSYERPKLVERALKLIREQQIPYLHTDSEPSLCAAQIAKDYVQLWLCNQHQESFGVVYLDTQHKPIEALVEFKGTIDSASVYPRVIVQHALELGASAVILGHNHPSGNPTPSTADVRITERITDALNLIDVRMLDHLIVTPTVVTSLAQTGEI